MILHIVTTGDIAAGEGTENHTKLILPRYFPTVARPSSAPPSQQLFDSYKGGERMTTRSKAAQARYKPYAKENGTLCT